MNMKKWKYTYEDVYTDRDKIDQKLFQEIFDNVIVDQAKIYNNKPETYLDNLQKEIKNNFNDFLFNKITNLIDAVVNFYLEQDILKFVKKRLDGFFVKLIEDQKVENVIESLYKQTTLPFSENEIDFLKELRCNFVNLKIDILIDYCKQSKIVDFIQEQILCAINQSINMAFYDRIIKTLTQTIRESKDIIKIQGIATEKLKAINDELIPAIKSLNSPKSDLLMIISTSNALLDNIVNRNILLDYVDDIHILNSRFDFSKKYITVKEDTYENNYINDDQIIVINKKTFYQFSFSLKVKTSYFRRKEENKIINDKKYLSTAFFWKLEKIKPSKNLTALFYDNMSFIFLLRWLGY